MAEVGDLHQARRFLGSAVDTNFGVGYRKDYQMDRWINLLAKINEIEPENTAERTTQFAYGIKDLEESTDGRVVTSAAALLLETTFQWSPVRATRLFFWFVDQGVMNYWSGMRVLVDESLKSPGPAQRAALMVIKEFLLPFETSGNEGLMTRTVERLAAATAKHRTIYEVRSLVEGVGLNGRPSARSMWLKGLAEGAANVGLPEGSVEIPIDGPNENDDVRYSHRHLRIHGEAIPLDYEEVQAKATSPAALGELLAQEDDRSFFNWCPLVVQIAQDATDEATLIELAVLFRNHRDSVRILTTVDLRMEELGNHTAAWGICEEALKAASEYDWHPRIGGGRKIAAASALRKLDPGRAVPLIWEILLGDLEGTQGRIGMIPEVIEDLLGLLDPTAALEDVWTEIEAHIEELFGTTRSPAPWYTSEGEIAVDNPHCSIIELIARHLRHPCFPVVQAAQRCLGQLLLERSDYVSDVLLGTVKQSDDHVERGLMIVDAVSSNDPEAVGIFREVVCQLAGSPSWVVREISGRIAANCDWLQPPAATFLRPLPAIYHSDNLLISQALDTPYVVNRPATTVPGSEVPGGFLAPFEADLRIVANIAGVRLQHLHERIIQIMHQLAPHETVWSPEAERRLASSLRSIGVRLAFAKPQVKIARFAMFRAIAELVDSGYISPQESGTRLF